MLEKKIILAWLGCAIFSAVNAEEFKDTAKFEATYGLSRTNQSLINGVLINYKTAPALNLGYENTRWFASIQNGVGAWLVRDEQLKSGLSINYMMGRNESAEKRYAGIGNVADTAMAYVVPSGSGSLYRNIQIGLFIEAHQDIDVILGYGKSTACGMLMGSPQAGQTFTAHQHDRLEPALQFKLTPNLQPAL